MDQSSEDQQHTYRDEGSSWHPALRPHNDASTFLVSTIPVQGSPHDNKVSEQHLLNTQTAEDFFGNQQYHDDAEVTQPETIEQPKQDSIEASRISDQSTSSTSAVHSANPDSVPQESAMTFSDFQTGGETGLATEESDYLETGDFNAATVYLSLIHI